MVASTSSCNVNTLSLIVIVGVVKVGDVLKTTFPVPVEVVTPVPPFATATVPVTFAAFPPMERLEAVPVNPVPAPANDVALKMPVLGTKLNLVDDVIAPTFPVVADEMTG